MRLLNAKNVPLTIMVFFIMDEVKEIIQNMSELQKHIVLLLSGKKFEPIRGNTWFQKQLFLIAKNIEEVNEEASFDSDFYGPYSENAEEQLEELEMDEVVEKKGNKMYLSELGQDVASRLIGKTPKERLELIYDFKELLNDLNDDEILTLIYFSFPEFTDESLVLEKIKKNRKQVAIRLYLKEKVSIQKAAEIAGLPLEKLVKELQK